MKKPPTFIASSLQHVLSYKWAGEVFVFGQALVGVYEAEEWGLVAEIHSHTVGL